MEALLLGLLRDHPLAPMSRFSSVVPKHMSVIDHNAFSFLPQVSITTECIYPRTRSVWQTSSKASSFHSMFAFTHDLWLGYLPITPTVYPDPFKLEPRRFLAPIKSTNLRACPVKKLVCSMSMRLSLCPTFSRPSMPTVLKLNWNVCLGQELWGMLVDPLPSFFSWGFPLY